VTVEIVSYVRGHEGLIVEHAEPLDRTPLRAAGE